MQSESLLRTLAERLSRGVILRRRLPAEFGRLPIYVTPEAGLRYWGRLAGVDPHLLQMARKLVRPGSVVWDVGANVGLFAFAAAACAGTEGSVVAIEPDSWLAGLMNRSSRAVADTGYAAAPVRVLCAAASSVSGVGELEIAERARASNHLVGISGSTQSGGKRRRERATLVRLDELLDDFPGPQIVKIDVESHEAEVLRGAPKLLAKVRPAVWCEVDPSNAEAVGKCFYDNAYQLFGAAEMPHPIITRPWWNTLAVPRENVPAIVGSASSG